MIADDDNANDLTVDEADERSDVTPAERAMIWKLFGPPAEEDAADPDDSTSADC